MLTNVNEQFCDTLSSCSYIERDVYTYMYVYIYVCIHITAYIYIYSFWNRGKMLPESTVMYDVI